MPLSANGNSSGGNTRSTRNVQDSLHPDQHHRTISTRSSASSLRSKHQQHQEEPSLHELVKEELEATTNPSPPSSTATPLGLGVVGHLRAASSPWDTSEPLRTRTLSKPGASKSSRSLGERSRSSDSRKSKHFLDELPPPESAILHPPLYGRPGPPVNPDIFATLLQPLLSLSRPPSPASTPPQTHNQSPILNASSSSATLIEQPSDRSATSLPAHFPPRNARDPGPSVESQGFVLYLTSLFAWITFLVWGLCPDEWLEWMGIEWYPAREWALLVPAWSIMLAAFVYFSYIALNIFITPPLDSLHTLTDTQAYILPYPPKTSELQSETSHPLLSHSVHLPPDAVPTLHDLPVGLVNRVVFGDRRRRKRLNPLG
ncbi:PIG-P-domain-containing protein [Meredithblackwellia eburnea MCA 4105]